MQLFTLATDSVHFRTNICFGKDSAFGRTLMLLSHCPLHGPQPLPHYQDHITKVLQSVSHPEEHIGGVSHGEEKFLLKECNVHGVIRMASNWIIRSIPFVVVQI